VLAEVVVSEKIFLSLLSESTRHHLLVSNDHIMVSQEFFNILNKRGRCFFRSNIITLGVPKAEQLSKSYRN